MQNLIVSKKKYPFLYEDGIEKSVPRDHRLSSLGKPCDSKRWSLEQIFYHILTLVIDSYTRPVSCLFEQILISLFAVAYKNKNKFCFFIHNGRVHGIVK